MQILLALALVLINGFFVAAEFAFIKVRPARLAEMVEQGRPFAKSAQWLAKRMDATLAACQLGITMASLALGWVGEPAFLVLFEPLFASAGITSPALLHGVSFVVAFTLITALHLVAGEQFPKIFALRRPEPLALACALPLRWFYVASYPLLIGLSSTTSLLLRMVGVHSDSGHDVPQTEDEIRMLIRQAHAHGNLSRTEDSLIHAVFAFDDMNCRRIMIPRHRVEFLDASTSIEESVAFARSHRHTRYPVCDGSLDRVLGVIHLKDLLGLDDSDTTRLRQLVRPPKYVPETMPISRLLKHFQASRQHMAFIVDEHGTLIGLATLEDVLEQIVGPVEDEFDAHEPAIVPQGEGEFLVRGGTPIEDVNEKTGLRLTGDDVDTLSGMLMAQLDRIPETGDVVELEGASAEVLQMSGSRAEQIRLRVRQAAAEPDA